MKRTYFLYCLLLFVSIACFSQDESVEVDHSYKPLKISLNDEGTKYIRFIIWHQQWLQTNNLEGTSKFQLTSLARRSRMLAFAQISPRFLILTHFGVNSLSAGNMTSLGNNGDKPQLFLHGAWSEFRISSGNELFVGTGLHYWKGMTRLSNQSTLNFMTMDNPRPFVHWQSLGITDQFARHMGVYVKGQIGKFDYRVAMNNPLNPANALGKGKNYGATFPDFSASDITYNGSAKADSKGDKLGNTVVEGYFRYNIFDTESTKLPYQVGTYHGKKKVLGIGLGFFNHSNGVYNNATKKHENVFHLAADVFYDAPVSGGSINAYASFSSFNYGKNYVSRWAGTGTNIYTHFGYFMKILKIMPYVAFQSGSYEALKDNINSLDVGVNYYVNGHNAKITLEYHSIRNDYREAGTATTKGDVTQWRLQTHIFL